MTHSPASSSLTPSQVREASAMGVLWDGVYGAESPATPWYGPARMQTIQDGHYILQYGYDEWSTMACREIRPYRAPGHITVHTGGSERPEGMAEEVSVVAFIPAHGWTGPSRADSFNWTRATYYIELPKVSK